jgi:Uma2 family endonuclease
MCAVGNHVEEEGERGWLIVGPSDVYLDDMNVFEPDLYYVAKENRRIMVEEGVRGAPDLVAEILSPEDCEQDRNEKREVYARAGVKEMWLIDPDVCAIEVHPLAHGLNVAPEVTRTPAKFAPAMFPGLRIDTAELFKSFA